MFRLLLQPVLRVQLWYRTAHRHALQLRPDAVGKQPHNPLLSIPTLRGASSDPQAGPRLTRVARTPQGLLAERHPGQAAEQRRGRATPIGKLIYSWDC